MSKVSSAESTRKLTERVHNATILSAKIEIDEINEQTPEKVLILLNRVYSVIENRSEQLGCEILKKNATTFLIVGGIYPGNKNYSW